MTKEERRLRHLARLEQKATREREESERRRPWSYFEHQITARATALLERPHLLPEQKGLHRHEVVLRLWNYPSFTPFRAWLVYLSQWEDSGCFLCEIAWDRLNDLEKIHLMTAEELALTAPNPTMEIRTVEIPKEEFSPKFEELRRISLPVFVQSRIMGMDGETFGVAVGDGWLDVQLSWWSDAPQEWSELNQWFHCTKTYFEQQLRQSEKMNLPAAS